MNRIEQLESQLLKDQMPRQQTIEQTIKEFDKENPDFG